jgi:copper(I)-binding protein
VCTGGVGIVKSHNPVPLGSGAIVHFVPNGSHLMPLNFNEPLTEAGAIVAIFNIERAEAVSAKVHVSGTACLGL